MKFTINGNDYIMSERKDIGKKPVLFLLRLTGKARQYVSSLYPTDIPNVFRFDEKGIRYLLNLNDKTIRETSKI